MVQLPMIKLIKISYNQSNHVQFNNSWFNLSKFSHDNWFNIINLTLLVRPLLVFP
jgi:hypothetical protein